MGGLLLFGYIRPFKPQLRMCEYDIYKGVYCGLCKEMGKFGLALRFTLSYDFAFLGLLSLSISGETATLSPQNCFAHPLKKTPCLQATGALNYTAAAAAMSIYHKVRDDFADKGFGKKFLAAMLIPFIKGGYKKAASAYPELAKIIAEQMKIQMQLESEHCLCIDKAAEATAQIIAAIAAGISEDAAQKRVLSRFGYLLGRYVYLTDALDDVRGDFAEGGYNPLLDGNTFDRDILRGRVKDSVFFTLGELASAYTLLNIKNYQSILDNIVYLGLKDTFGTVYDERKLTK